MRPYMPNPQRLTYSQALRLARAYFGALVRFRRLQRADGNRIALGFQKGREWTPLSESLDYQSALEIAVSGMRQLLVDRAKADAAQADAAEAQAKEEPAPVIQEAGAIAAPQAAAAGTPSESPTP